MKLLYYFMKYQMLDSIHQVILHLCYNAIGNPYDK